MQTLFHALVDQARNLIHLGTLHYISTGDRGTDMAIHVLIGTVLTLLTSLLVSFFTQGYSSLIKRWLKYYICCCNRNTKIPIQVQFDLMANTTTRKTEEFSFRYYFASRKNFEIWFRTFHSDKNFRAKCYVIDLYTNFDTSIYLDRSFRFDDKTTPSAHIPIPIWQEFNGDTVYGFYSSAIDYDVVLLCSDSASAIRNCAIEITNFTKQSQSHLKKSLQLTTFVLNRDNATSLTLGEIDTRATFDSLFFKEKTEFLDLLCRFKDRRMFPSHLPIENKLGILLYGPPGTGKTRLIAATANFLGYDVAMLDMTKIRTRSQLSSVLSSTRGKNKILVLEEFDCIQGILRRDAPPATSQSSHSQTTEMLLAIAMSANTAGQEAAQRIIGGDSDQLDLGFLLTKLDGLESNEGRIIIATTNHPERIDPALIRPGRLGLKICLSYATREMARDILCMVFEIKEESTRQSILVQLESMKENSWTPAVILQEAIIRNSLDVMVSFLTTV